MEKFKKVARKCRKYVVEYFSTNRLFLSFVLLSFVMTILLRNYTVGNPFDYKPMIVDMALILLIGSIGYLFKPEKQFKYYFIWMLIIMLMCIINSIYYTFYMSFASFGLLSTLSQVGEVTDSLVEKFKVADFIYIVFPFFFYYIHRMLSSTTYYNMVSKVEKGKKMFGGTLLLSVVLLAFTIVSLTGTDYSRLTRQWYREYIVSRFGIILYQGNDLIQSLTPKISALFGYDEAARAFRDFYTELASERKNTNHKNKYTGVLNGKNIVFVHMESMQTFLMDYLPDDDKITPLEFNGEEVTPTLNRLAKEGMFFSNFYTQVSVGNSSDSEFTLNTSLMPVSSGTVFIGYADHNYLSIEKMLKEQGYYAFSTHGNKGTMWNRDTMHANLGYDDFYSMSSYDVNDGNTLGLGISDQAFFQQLVPKMENIENSYEKYMGTIITLSNHSPFAATKEGNPDLYYTYGKLDLTNTYKELDTRTGLYKTVTDDYLEGTKLGNYIHSAHYADLAMGEFIKLIEESEEFNDTVFVFYGDHDAKLSSSEYQYFYNYDKETGKVYEEDDPRYYNFDYYQNELNRKTPLIIWSKNKQIRNKIQGEVKDVMGMYDILPTIGNMMGFYSPFALGNDIFTVKDNNMVVFPNGNFVTNNVYYNNSSSMHFVRKEGIELDNNYIASLREKSEQILDMSNKVIVYNLIETEGNKIIGLAGGGTSE